MLDYGDSEICHEKVISNACTKMLMDIYLSCLLGNDSLEQRLPRRQTPSSFPEDIHWNSERAKKYVNRSNNTKYLEISVFQNPICNEEIDSLR